VLRARPYNGGPPLGELVRHSVTPTELFFVRSHAEVPRIDPRRFRLHVGGLVKRPLSLSLLELQRDFPKVRVEAALECAGNRRKELLSIAPVFGELAWGPEAVADAVWGGVPLRDVLRAAGVGRGARHASFEGLDRVSKEGVVTPFGSSVPLAKAISKEVLLAYEMNGRPLQPIHGAPLRVVVPGYIGARSVKWLDRIELTRSPSSNVFQARTYKRVPRGASAKDLERARPMGDAPLNCAIGSPSEGARVQGPRVTVKGYALASGGHSVSRVEVSPDGGLTWNRARLSRGASPWAWRLWSVDLKLAEGPVELVARCFDTAGHRQPARLAAAWNAGGYGNNAWHRAHVVVTS